MVMEWVRELLVKLIVRQSHLSIKETRVISVMVSHTESINDNSSIDLQVVCNFQE